MPKNVRRNPRIFNSLKLDLSSRPASGREIVSGWNGRGLKYESTNTNYDLLTTQFLSHTVAPPVLSFLDSKPSRLR
jgi:hypothetical protein